MKKKVSIFALIAMAASCYAANPYIDKVYEYTPAPGQFVNVLPEWEDGDDNAKIIAKVEEAILYDNKGLITLGAFGGSVVFGFDHTIANVEGQYDFKVWGNAQVNTSEPGIIYVMQDTNRNGLPDDVWYEIAGSEYNNAETVHNLEITYYRPAVATDDVRWTASDGTSGTVPTNVWHTQPYYPQWVKDETIKFCCTQLPHNYSIVNGYYYLNAFEYGYADNHPNDEDYSGIKIDWAVDDEGNAVHLTGIDFVKVSTGLNQALGQIGESSTEIMGAEDLHPWVDGVDAVAAEALPVMLMGTMVTTELHVSSVVECSAQVYTMSGACVALVDIMEGDNRVDVSSLAAGVYILHTPRVSLRFVKR